MTFMREGDKGGSHRRFISEKYTYPALGAALWTLDGVPQDPIVFNKELANTATFKVVAFSLGEKVLVDAIAFARNSANYCGGVQIGEFLLYDRELTDVERRQTEAYLMKRWLGADHPSEVRPSPSFVFGENVDAVLDSDCDASVVSVSGGTGKLEKKGSGAVVLSSGLSAEEASSLTVHEGALHIPFVKTFMDEALFHFDASKDDSLVYATDESGNEYLSEWLDVRGNGVKATTVLKDAAGHVKGAPVPVEREVRDGVRRKMLGFGGVLSGTAAAMFMNKNFANPKLTIAEIAKVSNISEVYFRQIFKKTTGQLPNKYILTLRINHASFLLQSSKYKVTEIATKSGFSDIKYFMTVFKKVTGFSPQKYRQLHN
jgi:AraC-like DNA-binding protein